jgi:hypothetical protein
MAHPLHLLCRFIPKHPGFYNHLSFPEIGDTKSHLFLLGPELNSKERNPQHESKDQEIDHMLHKGLGNVDDFTCLNWFD